MMHDALKRAGHNLHAFPATPSPVEAPPAPPIGAPQVTPMPRVAPRRDAPWPEMVALYYNIDALRAFAMFAAGEESSAVLLIDGGCRGAQPLPASPALGRTPCPSLADIAQTPERFETAIEPGRVLPNLHTARLADHANSLLHTNGAAGTNVVAQAR